ncbi:inovirus-type Gp2 protein [Vibrio mediterranei]
MFLRGKVFVVMVTQHVRHYTENNAPAIEWITRVKRALNITFKEFDMHYVWVREHSSGDRQHYHWALILDATRVSGVGWLFTYLQNVTEHCDMTVNIHFSKSYHLLKERDLEIGKWERYYAFVHHASYLAKLFTKTKRLRGTKSYDLSRLSFGS